MTSIKRYEPVVIVLPQRDEGVPVWFDVALVDGESFIGIDKPPMPPGYVLCVYIASISATVFRIRMLVNNISIATLTWHTGDPAHEIALPGLEDPAPPAPPGPAPVPVVAVAAGDAGKRGRRKETYEQRRARGEREKERKRQREAGPLPHTRSKPAALLIDASDDEVLDPDDDAYDPPAKKQKPASAAVAAPVPKQ